MEAIFISITMFTATNLPACLDFYISHLGYEMRKRRVVAKLR